VQNGTITISGATSTVFGNGPVMMNCVTNITSGTITFKNTTFQGATTITKTGTTNDASAAVTFLMAQPSLPMPAAVI